MRKRAGARDEEVGGFPEKVRLPVVSASPMMPRSTMTTPLSQHDDAEPAVLEADLALPAHAAAVLAMLDAYSADPMGDGHPLSADARANVIAGLRAHPTTLVFLAFCAGGPVGIATSFRGFSTFAAKPLINVHDFYVVPALRGRGIGRALMAAVERKARETGCCKLTLEVQENNVRARRLYEACGFSQAQYVEAAGRSVFLWKRLAEE
jgi:GNAT superfamily N-acetyltransferase